MRQKPKVDVEYGEPLTGGIAGVVRAPKHHVGRTPVYCSSQMPLGALARSMAVDKDEARRRVREGEVVLSPALDDKALAAWMGE